MKYFANRDIRLKGSDGKVRDFKKGQEITHLTEQALKTRRYAMTGVTETQKDDKKGGK